MIAAGGLSVTVLSFVKLRSESRAKDQLRQQTKAVQDELDAERVRTLTTTQGALASAAGDMVELAPLSPLDRRAKIDGIRRDIVQHACDLVKSDAPRASYFRLVDGAVPRRLEHERSAKRNRLDEPTSVFIENGDSDQDVWELLESGGDRFVLDTQTDAPDGFDRSKPRAYRTYITVGVRAKGIPLGLLTINSPEPGDLREIDRASMRVLARLLAAAEVLAMGPQQVNQAMNSRAGSGEVSQEAVTINASGEAGA